ncbi:hypothetical protein DFQ28_001200 [Apophysomyces sp. BC1034]|nr:hypothetical protein DFQ30_001529 [Apophysomyces sp. BC1015]KAG0180394.1 hypothetical protein DFQ29_000736 [Apophysomyces sp. BC1021]KAG0190947.1 hypothetical protein DFQ28_001200 [Apophysomyces sp. BC1034]
MGFVDLPLELLLRIASHLIFDDIYYLTLCSKATRHLAQQILYHKYHIDLTRPESFNRLVHAASAFVGRHGYVGHTIHAPVLQDVANRLAVEIYDRSPSRNWEACLDFYLDKTLGIIMDHVVLDPFMDPLPTAPVAGHENTAEVFLPSQMGRLMAHLLSTLYPTLTAMFESEAATIHHRLLISHLSRHLDSMTYRYSQQHKKNNNRSFELALRHRLRVFVRFIGELVQADLVSPSDLHILTRQPVPSPLKRQKHGHALDFQVDVLRDLARTLTCRHLSRFDSPKGSGSLIVADMVDETVNNWISSKDKTVTTTSAS